MQCYFVQKRHCGFFRFLCLPHRHGLTSKKSIIMLAIAGNCDCLTNLSCHNSLYLLINEREKFIQKSASVLHYRRAGNWCWSARWKCLKERKLLNTLKLSKERCYTKQIITSDKMFIASIQPLLLALLCVSAFECKCCN